MAIQDDFAQVGNLGFIRYRGKPIDCFGHSSFASTRRLSAFWVDLIRGGKTPGVSGKQSALKADRGV